MGLNRAAEITFDELTPGLIVGHLWQCGDECCCQQWRIERVLSIKPGLYCSFAQTFWEGEFMVEPSDEEFFLAQTQMQDAAILHGAAVLIDDLLLSGDAVNAVEG